MLSLYAVRNQVILDSWTLVFIKKLFKEKKVNYEFNACLSINKFRLEKAG